jgi:hypothetical protein
MCALCVRACADACGVKKNVLGVKHAMCICACVWVGGCGGVGVCVCVWVGGGGGGGGVCKLIKLPGT